MAGRRNNKALQKVRNILHGKFIVCAKADVAVVVHGAVFGLIAYVVLRRLFCVAYNFYTEVVTHGEARHIFK